MYLGEALWELSDTVNIDPVMPTGLYLFTLLTCGAFIAFAMEISEFLLLSYTSSLTLAIANIFKVISQRTNSAPWSSHVFDFCQFAVSLQFVLLLFLVFPK